MQTNVLYYGDNLDPGRYLVRAAHLRGPGRITFETKQELPGSD